MVLVDTLAPLVLLIILGAALARIRFLGSAFIADLNKLAFWIALPALLFTSASGAAAPGSSGALRLFAVLVVGTALITLLAFAASFALRMPAGTRGTLMQAAFRGNLAYIGIPILAHSFSENPIESNNRALATAVIVMVLTMALYNILAVIVMQSSMHSSGAVDWRRSALSILSNPLLLAGLLGFNHSALADHSVFFPAACPRSTRRRRSPDCVNVHRRFAGNDTIARSAFVDRYSSTPQSGGVALPRFPVHPRRGTPRPPSNALPSFWLPVQLPPRHS